jgi:hypothetical protein
MKRRDVDTESYKGTIWFHILGRYGIVTRIEAAIYAFLRVPSIAVYELCDEHRDSARYLQHELLELRETTRRERLELDASAKLQELRAAMEAAPDTPADTAEIHLTPEQYAALFKRPDGARYLAKVGDLEKEIERLKGVEVHLTQQAYELDIETKSLRAELATLKAHRDEHKHGHCDECMRVLESTQIANLRAELAANAALLATQTDLARQAECEVMEARSEVQRNADDHEALEGLAALNTRYNPRFYFDLTCYTDRAVVTRWRNGESTEYTAPTHLAAVRQAEEAQG